jgi:magnesium transporter
MEQIEAVRIFATQKFLALPVVDAEGKLQGIVDVEQLGGEVGDVHSRTGFDDVYELLGLRISPKASIWEAYLKRFPWLLTTIAAGTACALLAGFFETTIQQMLMLAFFMTLVLGLNEAVAMQSVTLAIQTLHKQQPTKSAWFRNWQKEILTALLIGLSCAVVVGGISIWWSSEDLGSKILAVSLTLSLCLSSTIGFSIPYILHQKPQWSRVAAAPVSLALTDLSTLLIYFSVAAWMLEA